MTSSRGESSVNRTTSCRRTGRCSVARVYCLLALLMVSEMRPQSLTAQTVKPPPAESLRSYRFPAVDQFTLPNGVRVLLVRKTTLPIVTASILVDAGTQYETEAEAGLANLTASLLRDGTVNITGKHIAERLAALGAHTEPVISKRYGGATVTALKAVFPDAWRLAAATISSPAFRDSDVTHARAVLVAALERRRTDPLGSAFDMLTRILYQPGSPDARPTEGLAASAASLDADDVRRWYADLYGPRRTTVLVVGDVGTAEVRQLLQSTLGAWRQHPRGRIALRSTARRSARARIVLLDRAGAEQTALVLGRVMPPASDSGYLPLLLVNRLLGSGVSSRLNANLRERHGYTYGIRSYYDARPGTAVFSIEGNVRTNVTDSAVVETLREYTRLTRDSIGVAELETAAASLAGSFPNSVQTVQGLRLRLANLLAWGMPLDYFATYRERLMGVGPDEARRIAAARFDLSDLTLVLLGDLSRIERPVRALNLGDVEVRDPEGNLIRR
ncbi:MAG: insulinase family protein [Anaerolineae bacterium]|nr:insulinase family protein [Gemmatimonadaceae bacterium]